MSDNKTYDLWHSFMPGRTAIENPAGPDLYSMQVYDPAYFAAFNPDAEFDKWAAVEVTGFDAIPGGMEAVELEGGLYAVFLHTGGATTGAETFRYIFGTWLPNSNYSLDQRAHFEVLGEKYRNDDPLSEEEIWIPVKPKQEQK